jgi:hypothetical protein
MIMHIRTSFRTETLGMMETDEAERIRQAKAKLQASVHELTNTCELRHPARSRVPDKLTAFRLEQMHHRRHLDQILSGRGIMS